MKPIHFDFSAKPVYRRVWTLFVILAVFVLGAFGWQISEFKQKNETIAAQVKEAQAKMSPTQAKPAATGQPSYAPAFSRQANLAAQLLQADLNKAFTALESLKIPGVRLQSLSLSASQNLVEVEFEFTQLSHASDISEALMAGYNKSPWLMMNTNALTRTVPQGSPHVAGFTGRWQAKLDQL
jgi:hypothetical protein